MAKKKSKFRGKTTANARKQKSEGSKYGYLSLPKGTKLFKEEPKSRVKLDFLPYIVTDPKHPDKDEELEIAVVGEQWYKRPFKIHRNVGVDNDAVICLGTHKKKCPVCEYRDALLEKGAEWDDKEVKSLRASDRNLYVVVPKEHKDYEEVPHVWDISQFCFQDKLNDELEEDEDYGVFPDLEEGLTLKIRFSEEKLGKNKFADTSRIDFEERDEPYNEKILKKVPNLDEMIPAMSYEALHAKFFELEDETPPDEGVEETGKTDECETPSGDECIACEGTGENSKGNKCRICDGTGVKPEKKDTPKEKEKPKGGMSRAKKDEKEKEKEKDKEEPPAGECPNGYTFGKDCEEHDECDNCDEWEPCMDAKEAMD